MTESNKRIVYLASNNRHKQSELNAMLGSDWDVRLCRELKSDLDWVEDGTTFQANAMIKIQAVRKYTDKAILADDSGLAVDALDGAPGVYSSRYCGVDGDNAGNNRKLLKVMRAVPDKERTARFICYIIFSNENGKTHEFEGLLEGKILFEEVGSNGFGYDPLFQADGFSVSNGELSPDEKNKMSHRYKALKKLLDSDVI